MNNNLKALRDSSPYSGALTREQFLFHEMRTTAELLCEGMSADDAIKKIIEENLFQYPTERMLKNLATVCVKRLQALESEALVEAIANQPFEESKQICLYAMMKYYRLVWDFMITVIGDKYAHQDMAFSRTVVNEFFLQLQEQDDLVASWKESSIERIKLVLIKILVENQYLDSNKSDHLNPVLIGTVLEKVVRDKGEEIVLPAFNCFW